MSLFRLKVTREKKPVVQHPWARVIKDEFSGRIKYAHNSIRNPIYPKSNTYHKDREQLRDPNRVKFTVVGDRVTKEFISCRDLVQGLYKYKWRFFDAPIIRGVTTVEWPIVLQNLKVQYGELAYCLKNSVAILMNDEFFGGETELNDFIKSKYVYNVWPDYYHESDKEFARFIRASGRPCVYMHISIDKEQVGTFIFMLFSDVCPNTCENFMRLCKETRGGYGGTPVHRVVKDGWIQCGGFGLKNTDLQCENFIIPHDRRGVLGMANDGRNIDCSTQFFVLLQPSPWMAHKYVAFGQLIEGEETLKKIENVETFYESPKQEIIISQAGIFNMECHDIMINKNAHEYIFGHIEDLIALGELFYEALLERVFLEIQMRALERMKIDVEEEEQPEDTIHTTKRFHRKKEDIEKQLERSRKDDNVNNEFDVESYAYEPEEYSFKHTTTSSVSLVVKPEKKFYIALTDVPYPGEVSSEFDLKRFLQGHYCLESDLAPNTPIDKPIHEIESYSSEIFELADEDYGSPRSMNSEEEMEVQKYLSKHGGSVSYAGGVIRAMAKGEKINIFENARKSELITDDELRRFRVQFELKKQQHKTVAINLPDDKADKPHKIQRRQTGFVRPQDLERLYEITGAIGSGYFENVEEEEEEDENNHDDLERKVRLVVEHHPTWVNQSMLEFDDEIPKEVTRPSVLERLYTAPPEGAGPTLKDYRPNDAKTKSYLTISSANRLLTASSEKNVRYSAKSHDSGSALQNVLHLQHGKKVYRKISSDYVRTIDHIEQKKGKKSIRSVEFSKTRPGMSVAEYQKQNREYNESLKKLAKGPSQVVMPPPADIEKKKSGVPIPGDKPTDPPLTVVLSKD